MGFDWTPGLLDGLRRKEIEALVIQDPYRMGLETIRAVRLGLTGGVVKAKIKLDAQLIVASSLNDPKIQSILNPEA